jgi:hypothetical protein
VFDRTQAIRTIKGILNKLTPEKFDRLLQQLLSTITTADILKQTITLVFENAVEQPTYCAMYAELCVRLSTELPSFPPPAGSDKSVSFRQILLNTCQDEFEGTENAREVGETAGEHSRGAQQGSNQGGCGILSNVGTDCQLQVVVGSCWLGWQALLVRKLLSGQLQVAKAVSGVQG